MSTIRHLASEAAVFVQMHELSITLQEGKFYFEKISVKHQLECDVGL
jgi:hypothetical protein